MRTTYNNGITLVELTIVLVVIGAIVAAIITGKNIVEAGKVRGVVKEVSDYQSAVQQFKDQYGDFPGDMADSDSYFGTRCMSTPSECNGNGDGSIVWGITTNLSGDSVNEGTLAWRQLALSNLTQSYDLSGTGTTAVIGTESTANVPPSLSIEGGGYYFDMFTVKGNFLGLGAAKVGGKNDGDILSGKMAFAIDKKIDDGYPERGQVESTGTGCIRTATEYITDTETVTCNMTFLLLAE